LISEDFKPALYLALAGDRQALLSKKEAILHLGEAVIALYASMDDSLRFSVKEEPKVDASAAASDRIQKDFRGVACPMNFVKTKLVLDTMSSGQKLEILLDQGEPIENVPNSVQLEGHKVLYKKQVDNYWSVLIEKK